MNQDTICAIATAQGGAIGSIRVSGPEAISITSRIFKPAKAGKLFNDQKPYTLTFGRIYDGEEIIDEVLVSLFRAPHSYTGENSTEITCHGSSYILQQVMQLLIKNGCRMAQPGEYTQRALRKLADEIEQVISRLVHSFSVGNAIKNGVPVAIIGETNAGKSTLLNVLLNEERAIVSDIHGTTRDVIEDTINIGGVTFRFIDTAGIRETNDTIESLGIERTFQKLDQAEIVLWMIDSVNAASQIEQLSEKIIPRCEGKHLIAVFNKADLIEEKQKEDLLTLLKDFSKEYTESIFISAKQRGNTEELQKMLINAAHLPTVTQNDIIVTNVRHYEALSKALEAIHRVQDGLDSQISGDFLSQDIRECIFFISDIAGEVTNDMVLQNIFQHFCVGK